MYIKFQIHFSWTILSLYLKYNFWPCFCILYFNVLVKKKIRGILYFYVKYIFCKVLLYVCNIFWKVFKCKKVGGVSPRKPESLFIEGRPYKSFCCLDCHIAKVLFWPEQSPYSNGRMAFMLSLFSLFLFHFFNWLEDKAAHSTDFHMSFVHVQ